MATIETQGLRIRIRRFRVLIIGRANAGKTTILQKVCNTTEDPEIYDTKGKKIDAAVVESSIKRGNHDIANEMVFKSNLGFVFHDSCGFEAGSEEEFDNMKEFILDRTNAKKLEERIHAIWYCIPMDDHSRTFQRSEEKFFSECDTGHVPVVVIFTKFEALRPRVEEVFTKTGVWDRLCDPANHARPKCYVRLESKSFRLICPVSELTWVIQDMNKPSTNCDTLLERTTFALDDEELRLCLVSTQQSNLELCIKCAIE
ncbi:GTP-binding protein [Suillus lakei]|nr:GTP-binding protein [Suillus lakei]